MEIHLGPRNKMRPSSEMRDDCQLIIPLFPLLRIRTIASHTHHPAFLRGDGHTAPTPSIKEPITLEGLGPTVF